MQTQVHSFPTTRDENLPPNLPTFTVPIKAGDEGNQAFRYDPKTRTLYTDMRGETKSGTIGQFDNVTIRESTEIPELKKLWDLTKGWRESIDDQYREAQGLPPLGEDDEEESSKIYKETDIPLEEEEEAHPVLRKDTNPRRFPEHDDSEFEDEMLDEEEESMIVAPAAHQFLGDYVTVDLKNAEIQRESDTMVIVTFKQILDTCLDPKEDKMFIAMVNAMYEQNRASYDRYFGDNEEEDDE